jgi:hypothetical protein
MSSLSLQASCIVPKKRKGRDKCFAIGDYKYSAVDKYSFNYTLNHVFILYNSHASKTNL